jgi:hypothetical protein
VGGECLAVRNRPGNLRSSNGAAALLEETLPRVKRRFADVLVRADSDFDRRDVREACEAEGAFFAFVAREASNRLAWAKAKKRSRFLKFNEPGHAVRSASGVSRFGSSAFRVGLRWSEIERTRGEIRSGRGFGGTWDSADGLGAILVNQSPSATPATSGWRAGSPAGDTEVRPSETRSAIEKCGKLRLVLHVE